MFNRSQKTIPTKMSLSRNFLSNDFETLTDDDRKFLAEMWKWETMVTDYCKSFTASHCNCGELINLCLSMTQSCDHLIQLKRKPQTRSTVNDQWVISEELYGKLEYIEYLMDFGKDRVEPETHLRNVVVYNDFKAMILHVI
jgi:hypothetical protein